MDGSIDVVVGIYGVSAYGIEFEESEEDFWVVN